MIHKYSINSQMIISAVLATAALIGCKVASGRSGLADAASSDSLFLYIPQTTGGSSYDVLFSAAKSVAALGICIPANDNCAPSVSGYQAATMVYLNDKTKFFKLAAPMVISDGMKLTIVSMDTAQKVLDMRSIAIQNPPAAQANPVVQTTAATAQTPAAETTAQATAAGTTPAAPATTTTAATTLKQL